MPKSLKASQQQSFKNSSIDAASVRSTEVPTLQRALASDLSPLRGDVVHAAAADFRGCRRSWPCYASESQTSLLSLVRKVEEESSSRASGLRH